ncbi:MAG: histidine phosphatase family protein [Chitinophagaceae bacterium]|nr:histidine phosphatase family protein [Chitinophagaceae bacterium]
MRSVILIRHAKSSWDDIALSDFDRPLNERGKHEASLMAELMHKRKIPVDSFISSPAKRARKTAAYFAKQFGRDPKEIVLNESLYLAEVEVFYNVIEQTGNALHHLAIFAHNPGITHFVNTLTNTIQIDDMPTCSMFAVQADSSNWSDFRSVSKNFLFFDSPRNHR